MQLELDEARLFLRAACGFIKWRDCPDLYLKYVKSGLLNLSETLLGDVRNPADVMQWRIRTGSGNRRVCLISTDTRNTCGGYANGYIHTIHFAGLKEVPWARAIPGVTGEKALWPRLLLNKPTLDEATVIAIKAPHVFQLTEVSFLTNIPKDSIVAVEYVA